MHDLPLTKFQVFFLSLKVFLVKVSKRLSKLDLDCKQRFNLKSDKSLNCRTTTSRSSKKEDIDDMFTLVLKMKIYLIAPPESASHRSRKRSRKPGGKASVSLQLDLSDVILFHWSTYTFVLNTLN